MISLEKLKERKLVQWALAYLAGAWLLLQLVSLLADAYAWPPSVLRFLPFLLAVGFVVVLVLAWYHGEKGEQRVGTIELAMLTTLLVIAGVGVAVLGGDAEANAAAARPSVDVAAASPAEQGSIAVLPFENMSADEDNEYFSDGLSEELLNALAQLPELRVAARTSSFSFKGKSVPIDSIGRALNVAHVLEGSVRKAGDSVRITAQLIDAGTGYHLWSATYDRDLADIFAVQDEISRAIVAALRIELADGVERPLVEQETAVPEAHTLVLKAEYEHNRSTRESMAQGEQFLLEALRLDPGYARAHAGLADGYAYRASQHWIPPDEGYEKAKQHANRALALDPGAAKAHTTLGEIVSNREWDWEGAAEHFARALEGDPGYAKTHRLRAILLAQLGKPLEAVESSRRGLALDPVSMSARTHLGEIYRYTGQPGRALEMYQASLELDPGHPITLGNIALTHAVAGRHAEAIEAAEAAVAAAPDYAFAVSTLAYAHARAGHRAEAERILTELAALPDVLLYDLATVRAGMGDTDEMFALLEEAVEERDAFVTLLGIDPVFDAYRNDPRTQQLLDRMGLPHGS